MAGKAKAAKMSMKDIMFLFRRDAEGQYKDERDLNAKTKILKERRPAPRMEPEPEARRYVDPRVEAERDARRAREMASAYSRR